MVNQNNILTQLENAKELSLQQKFEEALKILDKLYTEKPNSELIKKSLINTLFDYGGYLNDYYTLEFEKARQLFERITKISPNNYRSHYNLGIAYFNLGQLELAENSFNTALRIKPDYKYCYYNMGLLYEERENYKEALKYYEKALKFDPNFTYALTARNQIRKILDALRR